MFVPAGMETFKIDLESEQVSTVENVENFNQSKVEKIITKETNFNDNLKNLFFSSNSKMYKLE